MVHVSAAADQVVDAPTLHLLLYPNPPLGRYGMTLVMAAVLFVGGGLGVAFATLGAWPVTGFLGLDVILLGLALHHARRRARRAELIRLDSRGLMVRRFGTTGEPQGDVLLEPYWVHVVLNERRRHDPRLTLRSHGRDVEIGRFLPPAERREIAMELRTALAHFRANR